MHPLDGPRVKIKRANNQIKTLNDTFEKFFKENPYTIIIAKLNKNTGYHYVRVKDAPIIPDEWSVIIGEIVHDLRSALNLLAWQLRSVFDANDTSTQFPICERARTRNEREFRTSFRYYTRRNGWVLNKDILQISQRYLAKIESFQPYKRGNKSRLNPIFLLQKLNNTDKHRIIPVLNTVPAMMRAQGLSGGTKFKMGAPLKPNAIIGYVRPVGFKVDLIDFGSGKVRHLRKEEMQVNFNITPGARFGDGCDAVKKTPSYKHSY